MSDSALLSDSAPSDAVLEEALRSVVRNIYQTGKFADLTVKRVRAATEKQLDLEQDFFRDHPSWKEKSKNTIQAEVETHPEPASSQASPPKKSTQKTPPTVPTKTAESGSRANGKKRSSPADTGPKKRRKKEDSEGDEEQHKRSSAKKKQPEIQSSSPLQDLAEDDEQEELDDKGALALNGGGAVISESEMSEVIDEGPKPKRKRRSEGSEKPKPKPKKSAASKPSKSSKPEVTADPDAEEIKRLQGWLVKCGIRKMWWKELQPCGTPKAKIRHLKDMLSDAGMAGRYSNEKAAQIKEERELKADLEAVQAGNQQWGKTGSEDEEKGRPKRKLAKGLENLDFLNDDDGEETD